MIRIAIDDDLVEELEKLLQMTGPGGLFMKHMVSMIDGKLRCEVRANEHPPPHFHVTYDGEDASYCIQTGKRLPKVSGLERYDGTIQAWWQKNQRRIALKWNSSRPFDCRVGPVPVPD
ncbi:DUF4160 domain-containing protein [Ensifer sp. ENS05]|uniref:DUF4160 domain-containing protein n=1 Tax=Ensifer sp. ENS05 TaxID=2769277 RepID=UPI0017865333|nr:DUF4160 domain-containing protein [Ensifer sp. ENS05]MBD9592696.1 DUF4160 domain-containing protein [Ensifer sp. ENS05]